MKVYVATDMEGTVGVVHRKQVHPDQSGYAQAQKWLTGEVNAAIEGARKGGADEFVVMDGHAYCRNILPDELDEDVELISGMPGPTTVAMLQGIDTSFDASIFIGYHARALAPYANLDHTSFSATVDGLRLNGKLVGEYGINGAYLGHFGIPVVFAAGDQAFIEEITELVPNISSVVTKKPFSRFSAQSLHPNKAYRLITEGAATGIERVKEIEPIVFKPPITIELHFTHPIYAQLALYVPGTKFVDNQTVSFTHDDFLEVHKVFTCMCEMSGVATLNLK